MGAMKTIMTELYETLLELNYPGILQITPTDIESTILASEDRLFLLSWLLTQSSLVPPNEFSGNDKKEKLVKWYTNMGICSNVDALLGNVSIQEQIATLRNLLTFSKNVLLSNQPTLDDLSPSIDVVKRHFSESKNIIPLTCSLSSKLNYNETVQYLATRRKSLSERRLPDAEPQTNLQKCQSSTELFGSKGNNSGSSQEGDLGTSVEKFVEAFESASTWKNVNNSSKTQSTISMDKQIDKIYSNMELQKQTMSAKEEVSKFVFPEIVKKREMPLDGIIEDIVIHLEEISNLNDTLNSSL